MDLKSLADQMLAVLIEAQKARSVKSRWIVNELEWVVYERQMMQCAVNQVRVERGMAPVTEDDVARVERQALGHCDYSRKFALYCAELASQN
jgi:hypothetical protein